MTLIRCIDTLVYETQGRYGDDLMFDTSDLANEEVFVVEQGVPDIKIDADYTRWLQQMQAEEQEKLSIKEKSKLFVQLLEAKKKHFAAIRAQEKRNKPPTKAQKRKTMSTYLKNMVGNKHNQVKNKSFDCIQKLFDKAMKRVNTFVDMDKDLVEGSEVRAEGSETRAEGCSKRAGEELEHENSKKQKVDEDRETAKLKRLMGVMTDEGEVALDAIPLAVKSPNYRVLDWKLYDSSGVHSFRKKNVHIHMLVEKRYPLTAPTITDMLNRKLQADHWNEIYHCLLRVNAAGIKLQLLKVTTAEILQLLKDKDCLKIKITYEIRISVAPVRNRILVYLDSDEENKEYCSLPLLLICFQTPQPCTKFNFMPYNDNNEVYIDTMTLDEYDLYMAMQCSMKSGVQDTTYGFTPRFFDQSPQAPNPPLNKKDSSLEEILDDLFRIVADNLRMMEHEVPNRRDEETVGDTKHESGNLLNFPIFPVTNKFASVCIQDDENINVSTIEEIEEVHVEDVEMDENHDVDHSNTNEAL
ncbi:hypothetical protein Tco_0388869 [Tanacetum coccineum]